MIYPASFIAIVQKSLQATANAVAAAMWVQPGDSLSFNFITLQDSAGNQYAAVFSGCTNEFAATLPYLSSDPILLHQTVAMILARDWPEIVAPTQAEIDAFCAGLKLSVNTQFDTSIKEYGLTVMN